MAVNFFNNAMGVIDAGNDAWDQSQARFDRFTTNRAGAQLASGNREGARQTFARGGLVDQSRILDNDAQADEQRAYQRGRDVKADERQTRADDMKAAEFRVQVLKGVGDRLLTIPEGQGRAPKLQQALELFRHAGYPEDVIGQLANTPETALTDTAIRGIVGEAEGAYKQFMQTDGNIVGVRPTGQIDTLYRGQRKPDWRERKNADGSTEFIDMNGFGGDEPPAPAAQPRPRQPAASPDQAIASLTAMGARVTSGVRTPEHNAKVGGQPNSYHLASRGGVARDLVPPPGMSMGQFEQAVKERLPPGWEAINEGDHIHIEPGSYQVAQSGGQTPGRPRTVPGSAAPAPEWQDLPGGGQRNVRTGKIEGVSARDASKTFTQEQQLRGQLGQQPEIKDLANVRSHILTIGAIAKKARDKPGSVTAQDDLALIFAFMKMLDPGSVVREGEFANAQNTAGIPERVVNAYNKALRGTRLSDKQRNEFFNTATMTMDSYRTGADQKSSFYRDRATNYGLNPDNVAPLPRAPAPQRPAQAGGAKGGQTIKVDGVQMTVRPK